MKQVQHTGTTLVRTSRSHMFEMCQMNEMIINLKTKCSYFQKYFFYLCFIYLNKSVCVCMFMCSCFFSLLLSVYQTGTGLSAP